MRIALTTIALALGFISSASAFSPVFEMPRDTQPGVEVQRSFPDGSIWIELANTSDDAWLYSFQVEGADNKVIPKDQWRSDIGDKKDVDAIVLPPKMTLPKRYWIQFKQDGVYFICLKAVKQSQDQAAQRRVQLTTRKCRRVFVERKDND